MLNKELCKVCCAEFSIPWGDTDERAWEIGYIMCAWKTVSIALGVPEYCPYYLEQELHNKGKEKKC